MTSLTALALTACHASEIDADAGNDEDAGTESPADNATESPDSGAPHPTPGDGSIISPEPDSGRRLPEQPAEFQIELAGSACFGDCPTFKVSIAQDGKVDFLGEDCSARPGVFEYTVAPEQARVIYDALSATNFASLGDRYTREEDGCLLSTDAPTFSWRLHADGFDKQLQRYMGCDGVAGLTEIDAVMPVVHERSGALRFLQPSVFNCGWTSGGITNVALRLSRAATALAMVKITKESDWRGKFAIEDCEGREFARGDLLVENRRWVLIDERRAPIALPAGLGEAGSVVIGRWPVDVASGSGPLQIVSVQALLVEDELDFEFVEAESCTR